MKRKVPPYEETQPYKLGLLYKQLGEMLMDERTDMRDLAATAAYLGCRVTVELVDEGGRLRKFADREMTLEKEGEGDD